MAEQTPVPEDVLPDAPKSVPAQSLVRTGLFQKIRYAVMGLVLSQVPGELPKPIVQKADPQKQEIIFEFNVPPASANDWMHNASRVREKLDQQRELEPAAKLIALIKSSPQLAESGVRVVQGDPKAGKIILGMGSDDPADKTSQWEIGYKWSGKEEESDYTLRNIADPDILVTVPGERLLGQEPLRAKVLALPLLARLAKASHASEKRDDAGMTFFDLPKDRPIGVVCVSDEGDKLMKDLRPAMEAWPEFLGKRYKVVTSEGPYRGALLASDSPIAELTERLQKMHATGIRDFYIKLYSHGATEGKGAAFGKGHLTSDDLEMLVLKTFPDCNITIDGMMCFTANMQKRMHDFKDHEDAKPGRVTVIFETKPTSPNYVRNVTLDDREYAASPYNVSMMDSLANGSQDMTFGAMYRRADAFGKKVSCADAGAFRSRPGKPALYTAGLDMPRADRVGG